MFREEIEEVERLGRQVCKCSIANRQMVVKEKRMKEEEDGCVVSVYKGENRSCWNRADVSTMRSQLG